MVANNKRGLFHISSIEYIQNLCLFELDIPQAALPSVLSEYADTNQSFLKVPRSGGEPGIFFIFRLFSLTSSESYHSATANPNYDTNQS